LFPVLRTAFGTDRAFIEEFIEGRATSRSRSWGWPRQRAAIGREGVLIEAVQALPEVVAAFDAVAHNQLPRI